MENINDREQLKARKQQLLIRLEDALNRILAAEKIQRDIDHAKLTKSWWGQVYHYNAAFDRALVHGASHAVKGAGKLVVAMFEKSGEALALLNDTPQQVKVLAKIKSKEILARLQADILRLNLLVKDKQTHQVLWAFAKQYYHQLDGLMILKGVGEVIGGVVPAILVALLTKNPEAIGLAAAGDGAAILEEVGEIIAQIEDLNHSLEGVKKLDGGPAPVNG